MKIIRGTAGLRELTSRGLNHPSVVSIGNFDGVHLGHQAVLAQLRRQSNKLSLQSVTVLFEPQPQEYFRHEAAPARVTRFIEKVALLKQQGVDSIVVLAFNPAFANLSAQDFIEQVLVQGLQVKHLIVGDDFCFGHERQGNFSTLLDAGKKYGFGVENTATFCLQDQRVSSSWLRDCLAQGNFERVQQLLGRHYAMTGRVIHGHKRGRSMGYPTINFPVRRLTSPLHGIYAVQIARENSALLLGVASIGNRPTVDKGLRFLLEVHLFDFEGDLYGQRVEVIFRHKIRAEQKFSDFDALKTQISKDCQAAKDFFAS